MTAKFRLLYLEELITMIRCAPPGLNSARFEEVLVELEGKRKLLETLMRTVPPEGDLDWMLNDHLAAHYPHVAE